MKHRTIKCLAVLLCAVMALGMLLPVFAADRDAPGPTWQDTIESVTPVGDEPFVKIKLTAEGYQITECRLPQQYDVLFTDGTAQSLYITGEPSHFAPLQVYENFMDVETPGGTVTLYAKVMFRGLDTTETVFSVGQYVLQGSLREDGTPAAGSVVYEYPILEEPCRTEVTKGSIFTRALHFFYGLYRKAESWFLRLFHK